jgi:hypothetical protein
MSKARLIDDLADDVSYGYATSKYDRHFFVDELMNDCRIKACHVDALMRTSDARTDTEERVRDMVRAAAVEFFTNEEAGQLYIEELIAEDERDKADEADYRTAA